MSLITPLDSSLMILITITEGLFKSRRVLITLHQRMIKITLNANYSIMHQGDALKHFEWQWLHWRDDENHSCIHWVESLTFWVVYNFSLMEQFAFQASRSGDISILSAFYYSLSWVSIASLVLSYIPPGEYLACRDVFLWWSWHLASYDVSNIPPWLWFSAYLWWGNRSRCQESLQWTKKS